MATLTLANRINNLCCSNKSWQLLIVVILIFSVSFYTPVVFAGSSINVPASHYIEDVPLADQGEHQWCGPASVVMVLQYWDVHVTVEEAGNAIDSENDGVYTYELTSYLEDFEFEISEFNSMSELKEWIAKDHPVVVLQWTTEAKEFGHYRVVVGYDSEYVYVNDPHRFKDKFTYELFFELWTKYHEYGLTISPIMQFISDPYSRRTVDITDITLLSYVFLRVNLRRVKN